MRTGIQDVGLKSQENGILGAKGIGTKFAIHIGG
jgi:hypothetical protein